MLVNLTDCSVCLWAHWLKSSLIRACDLVLSFSEHSLWAKTNMQAQIFVSNWRKKCSVSIIFPWETFIAVRPSSETEDSSTSRQVVKNLWRSTIGGECNGFDFRVTLDCGKTNIDLQLVTLNNPTLMQRGLFKGFFSTLLHDWAENYSKAVVKDHSLRGIKRSKFFYYNIVTKDKKLARKWLSCLFNS